MLRVMGGPATRDAAREPHRRAGGQSLSLHGLADLRGLDGIARKLDPGPSADTPYETEAPLLPKSLDEALAALRDDDCLRDGFGAGLRRLFLRIKEAEIARYQAEVTEWEQNEYFELF